MVMQPLPWQLQHYTMYLDSCFQLIDWKSMRTQLVQVGSQNPTRVFLLQVNSWSIIKKPVGCGCLIWQLSVVYNPLTWISMHSVFGQPESLISIMHTSTNRLRK